MVCYKAGDEVGGLELEDGRENDNCSSASLVVAGRVPVTLKVGS